MSQFPVKDAAEKVVLAFDYSNELDTGETLTGSPTVSITAVFGADTHPDAVLNGASVLDAAAKMVLVPVQAGQAGVSYRIKVVAQTTNSAKVLAITGILPVTAG